MFSIRLFSWKIFDHANSSEEEIVTYSHTLYTLVDYVADQHMQHRFTPTTIDQLFGIFVDASKSDGFQHLARMNRKQMRKLNKIFGVSFCFAAKLPIEAIDNINDFNAIPPSTSVTPVKPHSFINLKSISVFCLLVAITIGVYLFPFSAEKVVTINKWQCSASLGYLQLEIVHGPIYESSSDEHRLDFIERLTKCELLLGVHTTKLKASKSHLYLKPPMLQIYKFAESITALHFIFKLNQRCDNEKRPHDDITATTVEMMYRLQDNLAFLLKHGALIQRINTEYWNHMIELDKKLTERTDNWTGRVVVTHELINELAATKYCEYLYMFVLHMFAEEMKL